MRTYAYLTSPFLLLCASPNAARPVERALLLDNVHVDTLLDDDLPHTFAIYTGTASYLCRAVSDAAMRAWMYVHDADPRQALAPRPGRA